MGGLKRGDAIRRIIEIELDCKLAKLEQAILLEYLKVEQLGREAAELTAAIKAVGA
jgi:hypothetical protein